MSLKVSRHKGQRLDKSVTVTSHTWPTIQLGPHSEYSRKSWHQLKVHVSKPQYCPINKLHQTIILHPWQHKKKKKSHESVDFAHNTIHQSLNAFLCQKLDETRELYMQNLCKKAHFSQAIRRNINLTVYVLPQHVVWQTWIPAHTLHRLCTVQWYVFIYKHWQACCLA